LDLSVERNVGVRETVDLEGLPAQAAEVEEPADVVVLVKNAKDALGLFMPQAKASERR